LRLDITVSYSASLFDALNLNLRAYSATTTLGLSITMPTPLPNSLEELSIWIVHRSGATVIGEFGRHGIHVIPTYNAKISAKRYEVVCGLGKRVDWLILKVRLARRTHNAREIGAWAQLKPLRYLSETRVYTSNFVDSVRFLDRPFYHESKEYL